MKHLKLFFLIITVQISLSCSNESTELDSNPANLEYKEIQNVSYGNDTDQKFDVYLPEGRTLETKVMILAHGGGWTSGDKSSMNAIVNLLKLDFPNVAVVNINYRLADENNSPYPMQINDITSVVNHLKTNSEDYMISEHYGFIGISAGAHLSLLWSYAFDVGNNVNMVCSIVGPTNFTDPAYLDNINPELQNLLDIYGIDPTLSYLEEISPLHRATAASPPTTLFYGGQDPLIPTTQGTGLHDKLNTLGVTNEFTLYPNEGHGWDGLELIDTWNKLKAFMQTNL